MSQQKVQRKRGAYKMPEPVQCGEILTDTGKQKWRIGKSIGKGGFGEIYLASNDISKDVEAKAPYIVKIEPHENGPLFVEINFYLRAAKAEQFDKWKETRGRNPYGVPGFIGSGSHSFKNVKYRFLVIERFGSDIQKLLQTVNMKCNIKTALSLGIKVIDILEYIHSNRYVHNDIKASNLMIGYKKGTENDVYLLDYGLACRYISTEGVHKPYMPDPKKAHNGTVEYTSRDAHIGAFSRRGDLEILGYNILQWLSGSLPWINKLSNKETVHKLKKDFMDNLLPSLKKCFPGESVPFGIQDYFQYVSGLKFEENPDYKHCQNILKKGLEKAGLRYDGTLSFVKVDGSKSTKRRSGEKVGSPVPSKIKRPRGEARGKKDGSDADSMSTSNESLTPAMLEIKKKMTEKANGISMTNKKPATSAQTAAPQRVRRNVKPVNYNESDN